jgi:hypothetical protein
MSSDRQSITRRRGHRLRHPTPDLDLDVAAVAGTPERGVVVMKGRELVELGRKYGYRLDDLVEIIEDVG